MRQGWAGHRPLEPLRRLNGHKRVGLGIFLKAREKRDDGKRGAEVADPVSAPKISAKQHYPRLLEGAGHALHHVKTPTLQGAAASLFLGSTEGQRLHGGVVSLSAIDMFLWTDPSAFWPMRKGGRGSFFFWFQTHPGGFGTQSFRF